MPILVWIKKLTDHLKLVKTVGFFMAFLGASFSNSICGIGLGIYVSAVLLQLVFKTEKDWRPYPFLGLMLLLSASLFVSFLMSQHLWISARGFWKYLEGFILLYAGIDTLRSQKNLYIFIGVFFSAYFLATGAGIYQEIFGIDFLHGREPNIYIEGVTRLTGSFKHCNDYATFLLPGIPIAIALMISGWREKKKFVFLLATVLAILLAYTLLRSLSRSAILSLSAALVIFSLFFRFRWAALGAVLAGGALLWTIPSHLQERLHELVDFRAGDTSERMLLIKTTFRMIQDSPIFGLGLNTYSDYFKLYKPADYPAQMYSHNTYLQMAAESGLLGLALYLLFIGAFLFFGGKILVRAEEFCFERLLGVGIFSGIMGILVNSLFESVLQSTQLRTLFWTFFGVFTALWFNGFLKQKNRSL